MLIYILHLCVCVSLTTLMVFIQNVFFPFYFGVKHDQDMYFVRFTHYLNFAGAFTDGK